MFGYLLKLEIFRSPTLFSLVNPSLETILDWLTKILFISILIFMFYLIIKISQD